MTNRALAILIFVSSLAQNLPAAEPADTASMDPSSEMEEVTVTALRRSERLQDVPVSITALAGAALAEQKITNLTDVVSLVPNLQAGGTVGEGVPVFALRGVSMADFSLNQQGPVATYYDEVYKGSFPFLGLDLFDIERIEVLRGPQGTLYGKNTTGGAVNLISRKPGFDTEGYLTLGYGNYDRKERARLGAFASPQVVHSLRPSPGVAMETRHAPQPAPHGWGAALDRGAGREPETVCC